MLAATWSLRPDGHTLYSYHEYCNHPTTFTLKINHRGTLTSPPNMRYRGWKANWFDDVDADTFLAIEVETMVKDLGYVNKEICLCTVLPHMDSTRLSHTLGILLHSRVRYIGWSPSVVISISLQNLYGDLDRVDQERSVKRVLTSSHRLLLMQSRAMKLTEEIELEYSRRSRSLKTISRNTGLHCYRVDDPYQFTLFLLVGNINTDKDKASGSNARVSGSNTSSRSNARVSGSNTGKTPMVIEELDGTDSSVASDASGDSEDSDDNGNVEWVGCNEEEVQVPPPFDYEEVDLEDFASETESDDNECERKKALKKLAKKHRLVDGQMPGDSGLGDSGPVCGKPKLDSGSNKKTKKKGKVEDSNKCPWILHRSKSKNAETWWVKIFDDNHTCLQSRTVRKCTASFLSKQVEETIKPNPKVPISALKDQLKKKYELCMSDMKWWNLKQRSLVHNLQPKHFHKHLYNTQTPSQASTKALSQVDTSRYTKSSANRLSPLKNKLGPRLTTAATKIKVAPKPTVVATKKKVAPNAKVLSFDVFCYQTYVIIRQLAM
ncbi:hypothetical protein Tco_1027208 [Tanacetum coccineum]